MYRATVRDLFADRSQVKFATRGGKDPSGTAFAEAPRALGHSRQPNTVAHAYTHFAKRQGESKSLRAAALVIATVRRQRVVDNAMNVLAERIGESLAEPG